MAASDFSWGDDKASSGTMSTWRGDGERTTIPSVFSVAVEIPVLEGDMIASMEFGVVLRLMSLSG